MPTDNDTSTVDTHHVAVTKRGVINLPASLRKRHHLDEPGAQVEMIERADGVSELRPLNPIPAGQRWFWSDRWQKMEREAEQDIAAGRVKVADNAEDFLAELDE